MIAEIRAALPRVTARTASAIQAEVPAYRGPVLGRRRKHIETAVVAGHRGLGALLQGTRQAGGRGRRPLPPDGSCRGRGRAHARSHEGCARHRNTRGMGRLHLIALTQGVTPHVLGQVVDLLFHQVGHLRDELEVGHRAGLDERAADPHFARERLGRKLLEGGDGAEINELAAIARWGIPERMLIACGPWREELGPVVPGCSAPTSWSWLTGERFSSWAKPAAATAGLTRCAPCWGSR
ncbi:hypothetical protein [Aeromicrobium sp. UC242_57]|uniref:hypothetical protein n=1 Tax=Aeromicrobium sp. UC242_57 TaxID=3374624 RepID=UPI00379F3EFA